MLLLESMQSKLLQCKLLELLLDYLCPLKTSLPLSLSLLLHFMRNCVLKPDPTVNATLLSSSCYSRLILIVLIHMAVEVTDL